MQPVHLGLSDSVIHNSQTNKFFFLFVGLQIAMFARFASLFLMVCKLQCLQEIDWLQGGWLVLVGAYNIKS